jgi:UDP-N-acetylmuramyl pentapeptide synthase
LNWGLAERLKRNVKPGDVVLLKASRGVRLEQALDTWMSKTAKGSH